MYNKTDRYTHFNIGKFHIAINIKGCLIGVAILISLFFILSGCSVIHYTNEMRPNINYLSEWHDGIKEGIWVCRLDAQGGSTCDNNLEYYKRIYGEKVKIYVVPAPDWTEK